MLDLAYPWLLLLLLVPLLWWRRGHGGSDVAAPSIPVGHWLSDLPGVSHSGDTVPLWQKLALALAWILLILALARPQYVGESVQLPVTGRDLLLGVDISPSMEERDMILHNRKVDRLTVVKSVLDQFITRREGDRLGLLLFGTQPYIQAPLSFDHDTIRTLLHESRLGMAGRATAIGDAIGLAVKRLRDRPQDQRVLILLTDGANTAGEVSPEKAAEIAASAGVRIYTIGMGAETLVQRGFLGSRQINPSRDLDEGLMKDIAKKTGGRYFRARSTPELELIYENINQLEPIKLKGKHYRPTIDLFYWPASIAALLIIFALIAGRLSAVYREARHG